MLLHYMTVISPQLTLIIYDIYIYIIYILYVNNVAINFPRLKVLNTRFFFATNLPENLNNRRRLRRSDLGAVWQSLGATASECHEELGLITSNIK